MFTGIAVSMLTGPAPECAKIIQGTIAAAAIINEIIAVIVAKKDLSGLENFTRETAPILTMGENPLSRCPLNDRLDPAALEL